MASAPSAAERQALEKATTLPIADARKAVIGLARTQPLPAVEPAAPPPRRVRPVAALPSRPTAPVAVKPIAQVVQPAAEPVKPVAEVVKPVAEVGKPIARLVKPVAQPVEVSPPAVTARIVPGASVDDGWSQGRKRTREPVRALRPLAEGTQPGMAKAAMPTAKAAGKHAVAVKASTPAARAERAKLAEGSIAPPTTGKPLPSLFSVIDRKKSEPQSAEPAGRLPGLPPPPPARPHIGPKKAVTTVVAAASLGSAQMAIAATHQSGEHSLVPPPAQMLLDDEVEEIEEIEPDMPDFVPSSSEVAGMLMRAKSNAPTPLFDAPPRAARMPSAATSFSAAEAAFFAAGEEMDTIDMEPGEDTFDDLPGIERPSFWSRLKNRASAGR